MTYDDDDEPTKGEGEKGQKTGGVG